MKGLFDLNSADDLCRKLEADYHRVSENPGDRFAAFDFVVTAWHLLEWRLPGKQKQAERDAICSRNPVLRICEHLAVGAKHFEPTNPKLQSVQDTHGDGRTGSCELGPMGHSHRGGACLEGLLARSSGSRTLPSPADASWFHRSGGESVTDRAWIGGDRHTCDRSSEF